LEAFAYGLSRLWVIDDLLSNGSQVATDIRQLLLQSPESNADLAEQFGVLKNRDGPSEGVYCGAIATQKISGLSSRELIVERVGETRFLRLQCSVFVRITKLRIRHLGQLITKQVDLTCSFGRIAAEVGEGCVDCRDVCTRLPQRPWLNFCEPIKGSSLGG